MQLVNKTEHSQEQVIDLKSYWTVLMQSKWKIFGFAFIVTLLVTIFVAGLTPVYRSSTSLLIEAETDNTISIDSVIPIDTSRAEYFLTQYEILNSRAISEQVIDRLDLASNKEFMPEEMSGSTLRIIETTKQLVASIKSLVPFLNSKTDEEVVIDERSEKVKLINAFQQNLTINPVRKTQLVDISFDAKDPKLAALIANTVADVYINRDVLGQLKSTKKATDWLEGRLDELRVNLEGSINDLEAYRVKENLIDINSTGVRSIASDELASLTESYLKAKQARFEAETLYLFVNNAKGNDINYLMSLPEISQHPLIANIKNIENNAQQNVSELSFRYGVKHPKLVAAKAQLTAIRKELKQQADKVVQGISKELQAAKNNEQRFVKELEKEKINYQDISNQEQEFLKLQREVEANQNLYDTFLKRYKETTITTDLEVQQAKVIDKAEVASAPVKPNKKLIVILAFVASFGFAVVFAFVIDALNDTFRTAAQVESKLGLRLLGLLPLIKLKRKQSLPTHVYFDDKYNGFSEAVRTLRTGFVLSNLEQGNKVVLITSSIPGEGKTTSAVNIAFAIAQMERTLLIEADMRRPSFGRIFKLSVDQIGLSDVITANGKLDEAIVHDEISGLDILPAGLIPRNPLELLSNSKFDSLIAILKSKYDRIIIDSPPTLAVSDALILTKQADSVIYVVSSESTKQSVVKKGVSRLLEIGAKVDGVVLNRVNINKAEQKDYEGYYDFYDYGKKPKLLSKVDD